MFARQYLRLFGSACLATTLLACNDSNFSGANSAKKTPPIKDPFADQPAVGNNGPEFNMPDDCLADKADAYNIVMVFDASGSMKNSDPGMVRRSGGMKFLDAIDTARRKAKKVKFMISTVKFSAAAERVGGWQELTDTSKSAISSNIDTASQINPKGGTNYEAALSEATRALSDGQATASNKSQRNFVIFLSDGEPTVGNGSSGASSSDITRINSLVDTIVQNHGAAMITIASGGEISAKGTSMLQNMAKPTSGIVDPAHVGQYKRAASADEMTATWDNLFKDIACK